MSGTIAAGQNAGTTQQGSRPAKVDRLDDKDIAKLAETLHGIDLDPALAQALSAESERLNDTVRREAAALACDEDPGDFLTTLESLSNPSPNEDETDMSNANPEEVRLIKQTLQHYIDGAKSGKGDDMKPAFHDQATIFGYVGEELMAGPIQQLFDWNDQNGPATDIRTEIADIDVEGSVATARVESDNWTGLKFTDFFTLLKADGEWKIMNKVFHLHG